MIRQAIITLTLIASSITASTLQANEYDVMYIKGSDFISMKSSLQNAYTAGVMDEIYIDLASNVESSKDILIGVCAKGRSLENIIDSTKESLSRTPSFLKLSAARVIPMAIVSSCPSGALKGHFN